MIKLDKLTKYYKKAVGCKDIDLEIKTGDFVGFIGPNGSGKTTVIRTMLGLLNADYGDALIIGKSLNNPNFYKVFADTSYISNEVNFFKRFTVKSMLDYFKKMKEVDEDYLNYLISIFQLELDKKISDLSYGNKRKLNIIIALMSKPKLLVMDEPSNGLDPIIQKILFDELKNLNNNGTTIFLSSHILTDIEKVCNKIVLIRKGKIILNEDIKTLKNTENQKYVFIDKNITFDGLEFIERNNSYYKYLYVGEIDKLFEYLFEHKIYDCNITDVSLVDIIQKYYKQGESLLWTNNCLN